MRDLKEKLRLAHLALEVAKIFDFVPNLDEIDEETMDEVDFMSMVDVEYICDEYNGYGIGDMEEKIIALSKEILN